MAAPIKLNWKNNVPSLFPIPNNKSNRFDSYLQFYLPAKGFQKDIIISDVDFDFKESYIVLNLPIEF